MGLFQNIKQWLIPPKSEEQIKREQELKEAYDKAYHLQALKEIEKKARIQAQQRINPRPKPQPSSIEIINPNSNSNKKIDMDYLMRS